MNDLIFQEALRTVSSRRLYAKSENDRRYHEVNEKIPQIAEINRQLAQTAIKILDTVQSNQDVQERLEGLRRQNTEVARRTPSTPVQRWGLILTSCRLLSGRAT